MDYNVGKLVLTTTNPLISVDTSTSSTEKTNVGSLLQSAFLVTCPSQILETSLAQFRLNVIMSVSILSTINKGIVHSIAPPQNSTSN